MIIASASDLKKYVAVAASLANKWEDFEPYIRKAINQFTYKYVGPLHEELEVSAVGTDAVIKNIAREHLREAIANFSLLLYLPIAQVQLDSSGMTTPQNANRKTAEWWQVKDINRDLMSSGHYAMDRLLAYLEANKSIFAAWAIGYSTVNNELIVSSTEDFDRWFNIFGSRQTFLALQPSIRQVEDQYINTFLCPEVITAMKNFPLSEDSHKLVRRYLQQAVVAFTISKVCDEGMFLLDASGLKLRYDLLPSEQAKVPDYGKPADQVTRMVQKFYDNGVSYLAMARKEIVKSPTLYTQCDVVFINDTSIGNAFEPYNTLGVLGL